MKTKPMKNLAVLLLSAFSLCASAQTKTSFAKTNNIKQSVTDDGKTLHILVRGNQAGKQLNFDRTFAVTGMNATQKDALVKRINDSLGVNPPPVPPAPHVLTSAVSSKKNNGGSKIEKTIQDDGKTIRLLFNSSKDGKEINYDRVFEVKGMSKAQKAELVKKVTDSLGIAK